MIDSSQHNQSLLNKWAKGERAEEWIRNTKIDQAVLASWRKSLFPSMHR